MTHNRVEADEVEANHQGMADLPAPSDEMLVVPVRLGPLWNFAYIAGSRSTGEAVIIDPAWDVPLLLARAASAGLRVTAAVVTHAHSDHVHGLGALVRAAGARVFVHHRDAPALRRVYDGPLTRVEHGHELDLGRLRARLLHTPGHTPGSLSIEAGGALFTGDTLMVGTLGRTGAEPEALESMWRSVAEVFAVLPDTTVLYPGHDYGRRPSSTFGEERAVNPLLLLRSFEDFREGYRL